MFGIFLKRKSGDSGCQRSFPALIQRFTQVQAWIACQRVLVVSCVVLHRKFMNILPTTKRLQSAAIFPYWVTNCPPQIFRCCLKSFDRPRRPLCLLPWIECKHSQQIHLHSVIPTTFFLNCTTDFPTQPFLVCPKSCNTVYTRLHPVGCGKYNPCTL